MKSIRGALLCWFFLLLAGALTAFSLLAYGNARAALQKNDVAQEILLRKQLRENCDGAMNRLDEVLRAQVRFVCRNARPLRLPTVALVASGFDSALDPNSLLLLPLRVPVIPPSDMQRAIGTLIEFSETALPRYSEDEGPTQYFQISRKDHVWQSQSLKDVEHLLPLDVDAGADALAADTLGEVHIPVDDIQLTNELRLRRAALKIPVATWSLISLQSPQPGGRGRNVGPRRPAPDWRMGGGGLGAQRPNGPPRPQDSPSVVFQCAAETAVRDAKIQLFESQFDESMEGLKAKSQETLAKLRQRLLLIGMATLAVAALGCFLLVRSGLSPLHRLSEAVGQVSPKDFRLPFDEPSLPQELKPIVERLTGTLGQLQRLFAREKQAAADISHELRTPLAALLTTIEVALKKARTPEEYREILRDCHVTGQQMNHLVERLLTLARLDAGVDALRPREVDVAALAEQCTTMVRPLAEVKGLQLRLERNGPISMHTDPDKLREIVTNLLHNAIAYNRPHGSVGVAVSAHDGKLCLEVTDTGIGMGSEAREHIFDRFYREDSSRHAEGMHAGLGLSIVKGYTDLMGGTIHVDSVEGQGSTFRVELPLPGSDDDVRSAEHDRL